ncbi:MAG TPA: DUF5763 domain-containing protein [Terriglobales bacterium]|nr:DUF5763 domain-containing protein [Terriglobales bacterium]
MFDQNESAASASLNSCRATNKKGEPCRAPATETGFCNVHSNPGRAAEIGREGGRRNRQVVDTTLPPLPDMSTPSGMRSAVTLVIGLIYSGQLNARRMAPLVSLFATLQRSFPPHTELEEKINALAKAVAEVTAAAAARQTDDTPASAHAASA